jgi:hypothetical protein
MPDAQRWLLDTNILLRMSKSDDPHYLTISRALQVLVSRVRDFVLPHRYLASFGMLRLVRSTRTDWD